VGAKIAKYVISRVAGTPGGDMKFMGHGRTLVRFELKKTIKKWFHPRREEDIVGFLESELEPVGLPIWKELEIDLKSE